MQQTAQATKTAFLYGVGNFGFALLRHLGERDAPGWSIRAYDRNPELRKSLAAARSHLWQHPGATISGEIRVEDDVSAVRDADLLILAVESTATREVLATIAPLLERPIVVLNTAKALDIATGRPLSWIAREVLDEKLASYALVAGGTIAGDLMRAEPLGVSLACPDPVARGELRGLLESPHLFVYPTADLVGTEYASAFKSVVAIVAGIASGAGLSYGGQTHVISRLASEIGDLAVGELGAEATTFAIGSQAWGNDMWLSCTGNTRNREFGILLGRGFSVAEARELMAAGRKTVEGVQTISALDRVADLGDWPRLAAVRDFVDGTIDLASFRSELFVNRGR